MEENSEMIEFKNKLKKIFMNFDLTGKNKQTNKLFQKIS